MTDPPKKMSHVERLEDGWSHEEFKRLIQWGPAKDVLEVLDELGSPREAKKLVQSMKANALVMAWIRQGIGYVKFTTGAIVATGAFVFVLKPLIAQAKAWLGW